MTDEDTATDTPAADTPAPNTAAATAPNACLHELIVPVQVDSEEGAWIHWCATCGGMSSESEDVTNPKGPWFFPGDLSTEDVERINRAARGD